MEHQIDVIDKWSTDLILFSPQKTLQIVKSHYTLQVECRRNRDNVQLYRLRSRDLWTKDGYHFNPVDFMYREKYDCIGVSED